MWQTFFERSRLLYEHRPFCVFDPPFGGLEAAYAVRLRLIGKLVVDFLLVIIELFSLGAFVLSQYTCVTDGWIDGFMITKTALHSMQRGKNQ